MLLVVLLNQRIRKLLHAEEWAVHSHDQLRLQQPTAAARASRNVDKSCRSLNKFVHSLFALSSADWVSDLQLILTCTTIVLKKEWFALNMIETCGTKPLLII